MGDIASYIFIWHFLIGALSILALLGWLVYIQSGEKSFLYYGVYSTLVLGYLIFKTPDMLYESELQAAFYESRYQPLSYFIQVLFYHFYFYFVIYFLELHERIPGFVNKLKKIITIILVISFLFFLYSIIVFNPDLYFNFFTFGYMPVILIVSVVTMVKIMQVKGELKYYILIGTSIYIVFALIAMYYTINPGNMQAPLAFFFVGLIIENIAFSMGLSTKVRGWYNKMIFHFRENVRMRRNQYEILEKELQIKEKEIIEMTRQAEKEKLEKVESDYNNEIRRLQLDLLKNQMNPHFIFNALTSVKVFLIDNDKKKAVFYLNKFSKLIRKMLDSYRVESYTLEEEIDILKLYLSIENIRFNSEIDIVFSIDPEVDLKSIKIPPMLLQPFVENAIWHGLMLKTDGVKEVIIQVSKEGKNCFMIIEDNGIGRAKSQESQKNRALKKNSYGLKLVQERLDLFNKQNEFNYHYKVFDLTDAENNPSGTRILISFEKK
ncbi:MAG: histidine kinase [Flavobacteriia bacterium]|nr:histidine kinase [Flavobacteriia bacterium]